MYSLLKKEGLVNGVEENISLAFFDIDEMSRRSSTSARRTLTLRDSDLSGLGESHSLYSRESAFRRSNTDEEFLARVSMTSEARKTQMVKKEFDRYTRMLRNDSIRGNENQVAGNFAIEEESEEY